MTQELIRIRLPWKFANDHIERELPCGEIIENKFEEHIILDCTMAELKEWRSDAAHYCHPYGPDDISIGLRNSARACLRVIEKTIAAERATP